MVRRRDYFMAKLLFSLRNVPDDEADDVRALLDEHGIDYYETSAGRWGISFPGIWLHDDTRLKEARALIDDYEKKRADEQQALYQSQVQRGEQRTMLHIFLENPLKFTFYLLLVAVILYFSISPFVNLALSP